MAKRLWLPIAMLLTVVSFAQKPAEIGLISDNDVYTSPINDQYYTNGIELLYRYLGTSGNENVAKKITEFRAGHYIFNPQSVRAADLRAHDRPFAGYLFAEAGINTFYTNESVLKLNFQAGVVGPKSGARQFQTRLHEVLGLPTVRGWDYQIKNTLALQGNAVYLQKVLAGRYHETTDFYLQAQADAGTIWVGASVGVMVRISLRGLLLPMFDSALHGAALHKDATVRKAQQEFFIYINPNITYQVYDATIQGSMFNDDSPVTFNIVPYRFNGEAGVKYRRNNWTYTYAFNYRGKELYNNVIEGYYYGSLQVCYAL